MPFTVIKGRFAPEFGRPDGDSMRFVPDDPSPIFSLRRRGRPPKVNGTNGSIQLRYEAIDTMESAALMPFSSDATESNIQLATADGGRGYICSNQLGPNGRPICFVFAGDTPTADGDDVFLSPDDIMDSINVKQLERGHAYPLFYDTLFDDLRDRCAQVSVAAKAANLNVWAADETNSGTAWTGDVGTLAPIFPKLWRRIDKFVDDDTFFDTNRPFANLKDWIEQQSDERVSIPSQGIFTGLDNIIETTDTTVRMKFEPHELVVVS
ncbi:MAG: hypothetical protein AB3N07_10270 [Ruegeria sp.]